MIPEWTSNRDQWHSRPLSIGPASPKQREYSDLAIARNKEQEENVHPTDVEEEPQ